MTVEQIVALRTAYHAITHTRIKYDANNSPILDSNNQVVTEIVHPAITVTLNNNYGCNESENEMWWDDNNQILYYLTSNNMERNSTTVEYGSKIHVPAKFVAVDYADIQMLTIFVGEDMLDQLLTNMKGISGVTPSATVTTNMRDAIHTKYFKAYADMNYNIEKHPVNGYGV